MSYIGELISIGVAFSWTATALLSEFGSKRLGNLTLNVLRMSLALLFSLVLFGVVTGSLLPAGASSQAIGWMLLSGCVGYVIGDFCLFQCYIIIGSRYGQLFMTLAPISAALMAWVTLGQKMTMMSIVAMLVTLFGISISVLGKTEKAQSSDSHSSLFTLHSSLSLRLPFSGVLFAIGAALCQGIGLVLSKIGMDHYEVVDGMPQWLIPFSANFYRCIAGIIGFSLLLFLRKYSPSHEGERAMAPLRHAFHDRKGLAVAIATTVFGPFVGVGFSLMAVQYTAAGIASTLMAMTPIIILLPSHWLFHEKITWRAIIGAVISVGGVSLFFLGG
jgi:drug/metabolite transporter (DMT)-like permease